MLIAKLWFLTHPDHVVRGVRKLLQSAAQSILKVSGNISRWTLVELISLLQQDQSIEGLEDFIGRLMDCADDGKLVLDCLFLQHFDYSFGC